MEDDFAEVMLQFMLSYGYNHLRGSKFTVFAIEFFVTNSLLFNINVTLFTLCNSMKTPRLECRHKAVQLMTGPNIKSVGIPDNLKKNHQ